MESNQSNTCSGAERESDTENEGTNQSPSPFRLMLMLNAGFVLSLAYGLLGSGIIWYLNGKSEAQSFFAAYTISFRTIISLGLILGTALIVRRLQNVIPDTLEAAFKGQLSEDYGYYRRRFANIKVTIRFSALLIVLGFVIFLCSQFPLSTLGQGLMLIAACAEYGVAAYIGRKLMYSGMMLHSLLPITVTRNLFRERELDAINPYVHVASTLTIIFVYVHVSNYYNGPFLYGSTLGQSIKLFLLLPAIIATPVLLIFNFYPRAVLRKLYSQSIDVEIKRLQEALQNEALSPYEKRSYLIEVDKMSRDELRYNLQLTLSDVPIGITILIMVLQPLLDR
ncbi:MAG: hypothetical protein LC803_23750 [Acidobacteria bacterium]|nr:hypothetical protein [Acidobacteriota bacterium]